MPPALSRCASRNGRTVRSGQGAALAVLMWFAAAALFEARGEPVYAWRTASSSADTLETRFALPSGFERVAVGPQSFAAWLRALPLKATDSPVLLYDGKPKSRQDVHAAVIDIDTGNRDLQQCADAVMRLRAEWLYGTDRQADIAFNFTSGNGVPFSRYAKGERPDVNAKTWKKSGTPDASYASFRKYMDLVFAYAGTLSLEQQLQPAKISDIQIGNVFIKGGSPGHAVIVADMAENKITKAKRFLLIQSYMPAQDMHVLKNPANGDGSPWYAPPIGDLVTPEWTFANSSLRTWP